MWYNSEVFPNKQGQYPTFIYNRETNKRFLEQNIYFVGDIWYLNLDGGRYIPLSEFGRLIAWYEIPAYQETQ